MFFARSRHPRRRRGGGEVERRNEASVSRSVRPATERARPITIVQFAHLIAYVNVTSPANCRRAAAAVVHSLIEPILFHSVYLIRTTMRFRQMPCNLTVLHGAQLLANTGEGTVHCHKCGIGLHVHCESKKHPHNLSVIIHSTVNRFSHAIFFHRKIFEGTLYDVFTIKIYILL